MPVLLIIQYIAAAFLGLQALKASGGISGALEGLFGPQPIPSANALNGITGQVYAPSNHVGVGSPSGSGAVPASPGQVPIAVSGPTLAQLSQQALSNPWGVAALVFVTVFLIGQLRGAAREAGDGIREGVSSLKNADTVHVGGKK
jgi:hypothetical protein